MSRRSLNMQPQRPYMAYYSHHKCATKWVLSIFARLCADNGLRRVDVDVAEDVGGDVARHAARSNADILLYYNAEWSAVKTIDCRGVHVIRDPRDILVSGYFSHLNSHSLDEWPQLRVHRERLRRISKDEGLLLEMEFSRRYFEAMGNWEYDSPRILEVKFEDLVAYPYDYFLRIFAFADMLEEDSTRETLRKRFRGLLVAGANRILPRWPRVVIRRPRFSGADILAAVHANRFAVLSGGRNRGDTNEAHHYRKGVSGDWVNHLTAAHLKRFTEMYPNLLERTGYGGVAY